MNERGYRVALYMVPRVGCRTHRRLIRAFGSARQIFRASRKALREVVGPAAVERIRAFDPMEGARQLDRANSMGVRVLVDRDPDYPSELGNYEYSPPVLFWKGSLKRIPREAFAVVGSRRASSYGMEQAREFVRGLVSSGLCIVSGGARGIDTTAHRSALESGGATVAVLGTGLDVRYPRENGELFERIQENGALISEFPFGTPPVADNFPLRNRVISALSLGVLVVQAARRSGALLTARWALEQGKDVFAVPNPIGLKVGEGVNELIAQGAKLVQSVEGILEEFGFRSIPVPDPESFDLPEAERTILEHLSPGPVHVDDLAAGMSRQPREVLPALLALELKGLIRQLPGKYFVRGL
jgi:DNA processing protein